MNFHVLQKIRGCASRFFLQNDKVLPLRRALCYTGGAKGGVRKMHTLEEVRREYDRLDALTGADTRGVALSVSKRAVRRLGCFCPGPPPRIVLSAVIFGDEALFWDTVRHEYAHAALWLLRPGERHGHDALWREMCRAVGCAPRATVPASEQQIALRDEKTRYRLTCRACGSETRYLRAGKIVKLFLAGKGSRVRCTRCGGHAFAFEVLK